MSPFLVTRKAVVAVTVSPGKSRLAWVATKSSTSMKAMPPPSRLMGMRRPMDSGMGMRAKRGDWES